MSVSGSIDFNATRNQIIRQAALEVGAVGSGVTMSAQMLADFNFKLNAMVKAWQATGLHVWTTEEGILFPQVGQVRYQIGGTNPPDHVAGTYVETALSAEEASGQTVISVDSIDDISVSDNIGIVVDDGTVHWSTVSSVGADTVTIAAGLDDSAAEGNAVFAYTSKIIRPLKIVDARRHNIGSGNDTPIDLIERQVYQGLPQKSQLGTINQAWYDPGRDTGYLYLWQAPADASELVTFTWHRPIYDFDSAGDNPDFPPEWIMALSFNLAKACIATFPVSATRANRIVGLAEEYLDIVRGFDREEGAVLFMPDTDRY